jgi:hypothetical protein
MIEPRCPRHPEAKNIRSVDPITKQVQLLCLVCAEALTPPSDLELTDAGWGDTSEIDEQDLGE